MDTAETMEYELPESAPPENTPEGGDTATATEMDESEEYEKMLRAPTLQLGEVSDEPMCAEGVSGLVDPEKVSLDETAIPPSQPEPIEPSHPEPTPPEEPRKDTTTTEADKPKDKTTSEELKENGSGVPWVSRNDQQVFKGSKTALGEKDPAAKKRPASRGRGGKGRGKGKKQAKAAKVVEVVSGEEGEEEQKEKDEEVEPELTPKNLEEDFQLVASSQEGRGSPSAKPKAKARARAPRTMNKRPAASDKVYKRPSAKSQASSPKGTKPTVTPKKTPTPKTRGQGKGTFAGRRPPKGGQAKVRFDVMQSVFERTIAALTTSKSQVQAGLARDGI